MKEKRMFIEDDIEEKQFQKLIKDKTESEKEIDELIEKRIEEGLMYRIK
ncbi:MAG: hypothetical protein WC346_12485 [Methanogenium sp.]|jgi:hypothetical protein